MAIASLSDSKERALLNAQLETWLRFGLRDHSGIMPTSVDGREIIDHLIVSHCLNQELIEPVADDNGFYYQLTGEGRLLAWTLERKDLEILVQQGEHKAQGARSKKLDLFADPIRKRLPPDYGSSDADALKQQKDRTGGLLVGSRVLNLPFTVLQNLAAGLRSAAFRKALYAVSLIGIGIVMGWGLSNIMKAPPL